MGDGDHSLAINRADGACGLHHFYRRLRLRERTSRHNFAVEMLLPCSTREGEAVELFELISVALGYLIAVVYLSTAVMFLVVRVTTAVGLLKEGRNEGPVGDFLKNFH